MGMVFYRVKRVKGRYYLVKEWWDPGLKKKIAKQIGPCGWLGSSPRGLRGRGGDPGRRPRKWCRSRDLNPGHGLERPVILSRRLGTVASTVGSTMRGTFKVVPYASRIRFQGCIIVAGPGPGGARPPTIVSRGGRCGCE